MPTELADSRVEFLRGKYEAAQDVVDSSALLIPEAETIFDSIEQGFEQIEENRRLYETAQEQAPDSETTLEFYGEYLGAIGGVASELQVLEIQLVYFDLNQHQRTSPSNHRLDHINDVSDELESAFDIDVTTIPVVWNGFAIDPLDRRLTSTGEISRIYAVILPRTRSQPDRYAPLIGHELGHAVLDRNQGIEMEFYTELLEVQKRTRAEVDDEDHFVESWRVWFEELFCDACGVLTFGPAYLPALVWHLCDSDPYYIERNTDYEMHPPPALRFKLVTEILEDRCPEIVDYVSDARSKFRQHMDAREDARPLDFEAYDYDELREFVLYEVPEVVSHDLKELADDVQNGVAPDASPERTHRLAANDYWLDTYTP